MSAMRMVWLKRRICGAVVPEFGQEEKEQKSENFAGVKENGLLIAVGIMVIFFVFFLSLSR